jgi:hypothetical protein
LVPVYRSGVTVIYMGENKGGVGVGEVFVSGVWEDCKDPVLGMTFLTEPGGSTLPCLSKRMGTGFGNGTGFGDLPPPPPPLLGSFLYKLLEL